MSRPPGASSVVFDGVRYTPRPPAGYFQASRSKTGLPVHWTLHRAIWASAHGPIPDGWDIVFVDGDRNNFDLSNLHGQPRSRRPKGPRRDITRPYITFQGNRYYLCPDGYYQAPVSVAKRTGETLLHRAVWAATHGPIPDGVHIHHRNEDDRATSDITALQAMGAFDHLSLHKSGAASGAVAWSSDRKAEARRAEWARKQPRTVVCAECGDEFQSTGARATYCSRKCCKKYRYRVLGEGKRPRGAGV